MPPRTLPTPPDAARQAPGPPRWRPAIHRPTLGIGAALLLAAAGVVFLCRPSDEMLFASLLRAGLLMAVLWLAYPQLDVLRSWLLLGVVLVGAVILLFKSPKALALFLVALIVALRFRPRSVAGARR
jgi:energy-converting hydrogenase Eha subunit C